MMTTVDNFFLKNTKMLQFFFLMTNEINIAFKAEKKDLTELTISFNFGVGL